MSAARNLTRPEADVLVADAALDLRHMPGTGTTLVMAFTGVEHAMPGMPLQEFGGTAAEGGQNHVLFVSDMARTWYSADGLVERIVDAAETLCARHGLTRILTIGNSMGGYGAVLFAAHLPVHGVAAFSPQVSMDPGQIDEPRWSDYRPGFGSALLPSLNPAIAATAAPVTMIFGGKSKRDLRHRDLLAPRPHLHVYTLAECHHNTASYLKQGRRLAPVARAALAGKTDKVGALLARNDPD